MVTSLHINNRIGILVCKVTTYGRRLDKSGKNFSIIDNNLIDPGE